MTFDVTQLVWSVALAVQTVLVFWWTGSTDSITRQRGWLFAITTEPLWVIFGLAEGGLGFILTAVLYMVVFIRNYRRQTEKGAA